MGGYIIRYLLKYLVIIVDPEKLKTIRAKMRAIQKGKYDAHACVITGIPTLLHKQSIPQVTKNKVNLKK
jgi:hypothetical protein